MRIRNRKSHSEIAIKLDGNGNPFKAMMENKVDSTNFFPADSEFKLSNYKPKILDADNKIQPRPFS